MDLLYKLLGSWSLGFNFGFASNYLYDLDKSGNELFYQKKKERKKSKWLKVNVAQYNKYRQQYYNYQLAKILNFHYSHHEKRYLRDVIELLRWLQWQSRHNM